MCVSLKVWTVYRKTCCCPPDMISRTTHICFRKIEGTLYVTPYQGQWKGKHVAVPSRCYMHETYKHPFERLFPLENRRNAFRTPGNYKRLNSFHNYTISMYHAYAFFTAIFYFSFLFFLFCYSAHIYHDRSFGITDFWTEFRLLSLQRSSQKSHRKSGLLVLFRTPLRCSW